MNQNALTRVSIVTGMVIVTLISLLMIGAQAARADSHLGDTLPAVGSLAINDGEAEAEAIEVILSVSDIADGAVSEMRIWNDGEDAEEMSWQPYEDEVVWTLPEDDGTKTVWVQFRDSDKNVTEPISDSIELDEGPTRAQFFMMMFGTLAIVVVVFSVIAFYVITRPNFKAHGADSIDDQESTGDRLGAVLSDKEDSAEKKDSDSPKDS